MGGYGNLWRGSLEVDAWLWETHRTMLQSSQQFGKVGCFLGAVFGFVQKHDLVDFGWKVFGCCCCVDTCDACKLGSFRW